jgi:hypothetical protein
MGKAPEEAGEQFVLFTERLEAVNPATPRLAAPAWGRT